MVTLNIKNSDKQVLLDDHVYKALSEDRELQELNFFANLREHSSGCAVFQKTITVKKNDYETRTIYLHKLIAERYLGDTKTEQRNLVGTKNGNKLDCRLENLVYLTRSEASRLRKSSNKLGYTGVYQEGNRFRSIISIDGKSHHLGMYDTPEEAARAYNKRSYEAFGDRGKINEIPGEEKFDHSKV